MLYDNRMNHRRIRRSPGANLAEHGRPRRSAWAACAVALVLVASVLCAAAMSWMYMRYLLVVEAARESRFVNAVVHESAAHAAFFGRADAPLERLRDALQRPDLWHVELVTAVEGSPAGASKADAARAGRALRGEGVADTAFWRWSIPLRPSLWRADPDAGPALEFAVPVFSRDGSAVIGAALLRRSPGGVAESAGGVVQSIWLSILGGALVLYGVLLAVPRLPVPVLRLRGADRFARVETRLAWRAAEARLRRAAVGRGVRVESQVAEVLPGVAADPEHVARALEAFVRHALARAAGGELMQFNVRAVRGAVEFSYVLASAAAASDGPMEEDTRELARSAAGVGGSMFLVIAPGSGLRAILTLPA